MADSLPEIATVPCQVVKSMVVAKKLAGTVKSTNASRVVKATTAPSKEQPDSSVAEAPQRPRRDDTKLASKLHDLSGVAEADVRKVMLSLVELAAAALIGQGKFKIPDIANFRRKSTKARPAGTKNICGKERKVKAKPPGHKILVSCGQKLRSKTT